MKYNDRLNIRIDKDMKAKWMKVAKDSGITLNTMVRDIVDRRVDKKLKDENYELFK